MPGLAMRRCNDGFISNASSKCYSSCCSDDNVIENGSVSSCSDGFWSKHRDDVGIDRIRKFWSELSLQARQDLLRIDKQVFFEQARKNMYCSRCNGLLLEAFMQIVMYGKSLQHEGVGGQPHSNRNGVLKDQMHGGKCAPSTSVCQDETQDPSLHPWGGVTTTKDGALTLLDCYLFSKSLKGLQNVFDSARARERERELLYPDACGGGGRGWISQGVASYGRGHGIREMCALHTARLSCDTLVDFWSALGEETRQSLLRMKEEDFIERLMYRFDSKRFCRDCRRNVIREFKELKELKRMRREPRCTSWFCVADTTFQCEVSNDTIHVDWHQTFVDSIGMYHHFEWALGSGEGKCDILEFENVGMNGSVQVTGLDLADLNACYITLRAWKRDGRCNEFCVKAHALKGRQCVHGRLVVGDGYVTITCGESIKRFFEHAEEADEEEDDDSMDKDGNDLDGECTRPQKHAKSPELAREFLLDAAAVIFKEQVEKAFREGTARQNAHSIFVCLALKLLEDRIHVACKDIITLEKQMKLLEEEEKEKREEEERRERKRAKEREKKLRRKERLRGKDKDKKGNESSQTSLPQRDNNNGHSLSETSGDTNIFECASPDDLDESSSNDYITSDSVHNGFDDGEFADVKEENDFITLDSSKGSRRKSRAQRVADRNEPNFCGYNRQLDYGTGLEPQSITNGFNQGTTKSVHRGKKLNQTEYCGRPRSKVLNYCARDLPYTKKVWEPVETQRRYPRSHSDPNVVSTRSPSNKFTEVCSGKTGGKLATQSQMNNASIKEVDIDLLSSNVNGISDFSVSCGSSSSSDNCSSCLSEGDSNTPSSQHQNTESSSTSDSEDSSQQSEGREASVYTQPRLNVDHDVWTQPSSFSSPSTKIPSQNSDYVKTSTGRVQPCVQNPVIQPSTVGYYPRNPIPWSTTGNGYMSYPHVNPYLMSHSFGYGYDYGHDPFGYGYGNHVPIYHQVPHSDCLNPLGQTNILKPNRTELSKSRPVENVVRKAPQETEPPQTGPTEKDRLTKPTKSESVNTGFSLFQFGGPVALSTFRSSIRSSDSGDRVCSKEETTIEEYNLFAARNAIQFSIY